MRTEHKIKFHYQPGFFSESFSAEREPDKSVSQQIADVMESNNLRRLIFAYQLVAYSYQTATREDGEKFETLTDTVEGKTMYLNGTKLSLEDVKAGAVPGNTDILIGNMERNGIDYVVHCPGISTFEYDDATCGLATAG